MTITHLIFTDVETTGLNVAADPPVDAIIEIAAAKVRLSDRAIVDRFETLILPVDGPEMRHAGQTTWIDIPEWEGSAWNFGDFHIKGGHFDGADWSTALPLSVALTILETRFFDGAKSQSHG